MNATAIKIKKDMIKKFEITGTLGPWKELIARTQARMERKYTDISFDLATIYGIIKNNEDDKFWIEAKREVGKMMPLIKNQVYKML